MALSAYGSGTEVRAWRAALTNDIKIDFLWYDKVTAAPRKLSPEREGYQVKMKLLACNTWHLTAVTKRKGFMANLSEQSLWEVLQRETTTPLHRSWGSYLLEMVRKEELLRPVQSLGSIRCGELEITTEALDKLVAVGLRERQLLITA